MASGSSTDDRVTSVALVAAAPSLDGPSRNCVKVVGRWLRHHATTGALIHRPFPVLHALGQGPTQEVCRHWLRGRGRPRPGHVTGDLADGAWRALAAS